MPSLLRTHRAKLTAAGTCTLLLLGTAACTPENPGPQDGPASPADQTSPQPGPDTSAEPTRTEVPASSATAPAPGEAPEAGGVEAWATQALGREKGMYYGHGWTSGSATQTAEAPVPAGSYGVTLACQGKGPVEVLISEGEDAPDGAEASHESIGCGQNSTVAVELETEAMQLEFTTPDGIHLYAYKIFERAT